MLEKRCGTFLPETDALPTVVDTTYDRQHVEVVDGYAYSSGPSAIERVLFGESEAFSSFFQN